MFVHVDDIIPGLKLASDIRLKAGSFLITRKELIEGRLNEDVIESIRRFASQIAPEANRVEVVENDFALGHLAGLLHDEVDQVIEDIKSDKNPYPNFITDGGIAQKVEKVIAKLIANPDLIRQFYAIKVMGGENYADELSNHTVRVTILALSLGIKLKMSIVGLLNVGIAALYHDLGILKLDIYPKLEELNEYTPNELEKVIEEHEKKSVEIFEAAGMKLLPFTRMEIERIIERHHRPDFEDQRQRPVILLYFAELVDEMLAPFPFKTRFNFTPAEIRILGDRFSRRQGLVNILMALVKLHIKAGGFRSQVVEALLELFEMRELTIDGYEEKLREIVEASIFKAAVPYPNMGGNNLPRTIYCNNSRDGNFTCPNLGQSTIEIIISGKARSFKKCSELTNRLTRLNEAGRDTAEKESNSNKQAKAAVKKDQKQGDEKK